MNINYIQERQKAAGQRTYSFAKHGNKTYPFNLIKLKSLEPGRYRMRVLWVDPAKNPDGLFLYATHTLMKDTKEGDSVLAAECLPPGEGYPGITQALGVIEDRKLYARLESMGSKTETLRAAIQALVPWRRWWLPVFLWADEIPGEKYPTYRPSSKPDATPLDKVLEINDGIKLVEALFNTVRAYPDLNDPVHGRDLYLVRSKTSYSLEASPKASPLASSLVRFASENYPDLNKTARRFSYADPALVCADIKASWWAKSLETWWEKEQSQLGVTDPQPLFPEYSPDYLGEVAGEATDGVEVVDEADAPADMEPAWGWDGETDYYDGVPVAPAAAPAAALPPPPSSPKRPAPPPRRAAQ